MPRSKPIIDAQIVSIPAFGIVVEVMRKRGEPWDVKLTGRMSASDLASPFAPRHSVPVIALARAAPYGWRRPRKARPGKARPARAGKR